MKIKIKIYLFIFIANLMIFTSLITVQANQIDDSIDKQYLEIYNSIISAYKKTQSDSNEIEDDVNPYTEIAVIYDELYYALDDINDKDSIPELIIAYGEAKTILDIRTFKNNTCLNLFNTDYIHIGEKRLCSIGENGNLYLFEPEGAFCAYEYIYYIGANGNLIEIERIRVDVNNDTLLYYDELNNVQISKEEFDKRIINNYNNGDKLEWHPITEELNLSVEESSTEDNTDKTIEDKDKNSNDDKDEKQSDSNSSLSEKYFVETKDNTYKYTGALLDSNKKYYVSGDLIIDVPLTLPIKSTVYIQGDLIIENEISLSDTATVFCDKDIKVKSKGIVNLSQGGTIRAMKNFVFDSSIDHGKYLRNGKIIVGKNAEIKRNFYASDKNEFEIIANDKKVHKLYVNKNWFSDMQSFGTLHIVKGGCEWLELKKEFKCENLIFDNWEIFKNQFYGNNLKLIDRNIGFKVPKYVTNNIEVGLFNETLSHMVKIPFLELNFISINEKDLKYYYYNYEHKKVKCYTLDINYTGMEIKGVGGNGTVIYKEDDKIYKYLISIDKKAMIDMEKDFINLTSNTLAENAINDMTPININFCKSIVSSKLWKDLYDTMIDASNLNNATSDLVELGKIFNNLKDDKANKFIKFLIEEKKEIEKYRNLSTQESDKISTKRKSNL